eukprot:3541880-Karenia_brevis.AAC.1
MSAPLNRRPNRSAADRRLQHERATARAYSKLISHVHALHHRGNQVPAVLHDSVSSFLNSGDSSATMERQ